jgi:hypothetical protein
VSPACDIYSNIYRIMAVMKVEIDIITSITVSLIGPAEILAIMYAKTLNLTFYVNNTKIMF